MSTPPNNHHRHLPDDDNDMQKKIADLRALNQRLLIELSKIRAVATRKAELKRMRESKLFQSFSTIDLQREQLGQRKLDELSSSSSLEKVDVVGYEEVKVETNSEGVAEATEEEEKIDDVEKEDKEKIFEVVESRQENKVEADDGVGEQVKVQTFEFEEMEEGNDVAKGKVQTIEFKEEKEEPNDIAEGKVQTFEEDEKEETGHAEKGKVQTFEEEEKEETGDVEEENVQTFEFEEKKEEVDDVGENNHDHEKPMKYNSIFIPQAAKLEDINLDSSSKRMDINESDSEEDKEDPVLYRPQNNSASSSSLGGKHKFWTKVLAVSGAAVIAIGVFSFAYVGRK